MVPYIKTMQLWIKKNEYCWVTKIYFFHVIWMCVALAAKVGAYVRHWNGWRVHSQKEFSSPALFLSPFMNEISMSELANSVRSPTGPSWFARWAHEWNCRTDATVKAEKAEKNALTDITKQYDTQFHCGRHVRTTRVKGWPLKLPYRECLQKFEGDCSWGRSKNEEFAKMSQSLRSSPGDLLLKCLKYSSDPIILADLTVIRPKEDKMQIPAQVWCLLWLTEWFCGKKSSTCMQKLSLCRMYLTQEKPNTGSWWWVRMEWYSSLQSSIIEDWPKILWI